MFPIYKGMYERGADPPQPGSSADRDLVIQWAKDLGRSLDYLQTRQDIDGTKLAFFGWSLGGIYGPLLTAVDGRFKASVLESGGLPATPATCCLGPLPEADPFNFAQRDRTPRSCSTAVVIS
jgi:dienelactone hydrolase